MLDNYYLNNTQYEAKSKFVDDINVLFATAINQSYNNEPSPFTTKELENIQTFFNSCPKEFYDEILLQIINNFVSRLNYRYSTAYRGFRDINDFFTKFITQDKFSSTLPRIPQNVEIHSSFQVIYCCLIGDYYDLASFYLTNFVTKENRNISYLSNLIPIFLSQKRYTAIDYLLTNLDGWDDRILQYFIEAGNYDNVLLKKVIAKSGKIHNDNLINLISQLNWTLDIKKETLDNCISFENFSQSALNFYLSYFKNSPNSPSLLEAEKEKLLKNEATFLNNFNNKKYIKQWIKETPYVFMNNLDFLLDEKLIDPSLAKEILISEISQSAYMEYSHYNQSLIDKYFKKLNISWDSIEGQTFILNSYERNILIATQLFLNKIETLNNFDPTLELNVISKGVNYKNLDDYFTQKNNLIYLFYQFKNEKNSSKKESLFEKIITSANKTNEPIKEQDFSNTSLFTSFYQYIYSKENSAENFFTKWLIQYSVKEDTFSPSLRSLITSKFSKEVNELLFDLRTSNPFFDFLSLYTDDSISGINSSHFHTLSSIFQYKIAYLKNENNISIINYLKPFELRNNLKEHLVKYSVDSNKNGFFKFFAEEKKPLQLHLKDGHVTVIYETKDLIESTTKNDNNTYETNYNLNKFDEIILLAKKDSLELNKVFTKYVEKNLNLEVKIRADKLIRQNIIFLENIQNSIETIDFDDIFFLKNNLGKYLIQCIDTYGKSITRYENLLAAEGSKILYKKNQDDLDDYKEKIDNEALKQLTLLEKELDLVKEHIINQFNGDLLSDMRVNTRILKGRMQHNPLTNIDSEKEIASEILSEINEHGENSGAKVVTLNSPKL